MEEQMISQLLQTHGSSGAFIAIMGWFVVKKLPKLIERHLDSIDNHFKAVTQALTSLSDREDERHRELIQYIQEVKKNGRSHT